jgi:hypothetical protein
MAKTGYIEDQFEQWFKSTPQLLGEPLLLVNSQSAIKRMVDLIALDREGRLVIIEVKSKPTTREAIGQALEYLSQYDEVSLDVLADEYKPGKGDLRADFEKTFGEPLTQLAKGRRVYIVAPAHDPYSAVCTGYLSAHLSEGITFHLLTASPASAGCFDVQPYRCPPIKKGAALNEGFALSLRSGRLFYVIAPGHTPIVWYIGSWNAKQGRLRSVPKSSHTLLRPWRSFLVQDAHLQEVLAQQVANQVDPSSKGSVWRRVGKPGRNAFVIGRVTLRKDASYFAFAEFWNGRFKRFRWRVAQTFLDQWKKTEAPPRPWGDIVALARTT